MTIIKLQSGDGEVFETDVEVAKCSGFIKNMLDERMMSHEEIGILPLTNINTDTLRRVLEWASYHKDDPIEPDDNENPEKKEWDAKFLAVDHRVLFDLLSAANYLDAKKLLDLVCKNIANMIKGKSPEDIRQTFNLVNDFGPDEESELRRD